VDVILWVPKDVATNDELERGDAQVNDNSDQNDLDNDGIPDDEQD
jgi:hypothetical protein